MFMIKEDLTGQRFGRLTVIGPAPRKTNFARWQCACECGNLHQADSTNLKRGHVTSCGCLRRETSRSHGKSGTPTFQSWLAMRARCGRESHSDYSSYGGRGIVVCPHWSKFENFLSDMGERPAGTTLDRIDVNGHYEPSNCRWSTASAQQSNKRNNRVIAFEGRLKTRAAWMADLGLSRGYLDACKRRGLTEAEAMAHGRFIANRRASLKARPAYRPVAES